MAHGNELLSQKYYYLKLPKNWLKSNVRVKIMRKRIGDKGVVIYLKMMLLSISCNATIIYEGIEKTVEEELAVKIDEKLERVIKVVNFLIESSLIERQTNGDLLLVEVVGMIGSETYGNIIRKNKKSEWLEDCKPNANPMLTKKEIEKDINIKEINNKNKMNENTSDGDLKIEETAIDYSIPTKWGLDEVNKALKLKLLKDQGETLVEEQEKYLYAYFNHDMPF